MLSQEVLEVLKTAGASFGLGLALTFVTREVARRTGFVARPRPERWHSRPTALAGGVGIFLAFAPIAFFAADKPLRYGVLAGACAMFVLGLADDVFRLKPYLKLVAQLLVAAATLAFGPVLPWTPYTVVNQGLTLFWIIGITNAINLLDNMDGLAGGIACLGAVFQGCFFALQHQVAHACVAFALAGAVLGFLAFNFNPASIFMGDCGSLLLGYALATLALQQSYGRSRGLLAVIAVPVLVLLIPIFDTTFVTVTRLVRGRPVSLGGRDHTSHRLVTLGLSERRAVALLWAIGALAGGMALLTRLGHPGALWIGAPLLAIALSVVAIHLARSDHYEAKPGERNVLLAVAAFGYKRRLFEVLLDVCQAMAAIAAAFLLRFDGDLPDPVSHDLVRVFPMLVCAKILGLLVSGAYSGIWRYVGVRDLFRLVRGAVLGSLFGIALVAMWFRLGALSRGALILDGILFTGLVMGSRLSFRLLRIFLGGRPSAAASRVLLWGAGDAGEVMARRLLVDRETQMIPMGFIDDDARKVGRTIHGLRVLGGSEKILEVIRSGAADSVLVTSDRIPLDQISRVSIAVGQDRVRRMRLSFESALGDQRTGGQQAG